MNCLRPTFGIYLLLVVAQACWGDLVLQPTDLHPGNSYRLAFVTAGQRDATSSNLANYNAFVASAAGAVPALASLPTSWTAIVSTSFLDDARHNTGTVRSTDVGGSLGVPIYLLNGSRLADSNDDLWDGSLHIPFNHTEQGTTLSAFVWTGTQTNGYSSAQPLGGSLARYGSTAVTNTAWIDSFSDSNTAFHHMYAISGVLTVAVPEPNAFRLLFVTLCGVGLAQSSIYLRNWRAAGARPRPR